MAFRVSGLTVYGLPGATFSIAIPDGYKGPLMPGSGIRACLERKEKGPADACNIAVVTQRKIKAAPTTAHLRALYARGAAFDDDTSDGSSDM